MHCFGVSNFFDPLSLSKKYHLEVFHKLKKRLPVNTEELDWG